jgi:hypothetical protein
MRGEREAAVCIKPGIVENDVEPAVTQSTAGRIEVEFLDNGSLLVDRMSGFSVELQSKISELKWRCPDLCPNVLIGKQEQVSHRLLRPLPDIAPENLID